MLFAAGFGTRMGELTRDTPKPLLKVAGKTLLDRTLELTTVIAAERTIVNAHYHHQKVAEHLKGTGVQVSIELPDILETGGGLRNALPLLGDGPVFTSNTDAVWHGPNPFEMLRDAWRPDDMDALLLCLPKENAIGHKGTGDFVLNEVGQIRRGPGVVYSGVQILKTGGLADIAETSFSLNVLWDKMCASGRLYGLTYPGKWCDVGSPEGLQLAEGLLEAKDV
ncbi:MurNAc alpha-1-phosphate uridylyltransferase [Shimia sagamensis]|uniref:MurNAc alpha-1-phosphate uridylyltransferase n=2 Tax=Shimia sagamensis TaxID=1566352 RepID=A0ABY1ND39_9RHOB|nr:MurNAc alpha-1-phosphate uridylyltransferase [Shimia sagamensis]